VLGARASLADQVLPGVFDALALLGTLWYRKGSLSASGVVTDKDALKGERVSFKRSPVQRFDQRWLAHCVGICLRRAEDWPCECQAQSHLSVEGGGCSAVAIRSTTDGRKVGRVSTAVKSMRGRQFLAGW
jgi:hypothetical protein